MKVAIYTRESGSRQYKPASAREMYSTSTVFCLPYTLGGKRRWEQLKDVHTYKQAQAASFKRLGDLITEECTKNSLGTRIVRALNIPAPRPKPEPKPVVPGGLMLDAAIDKYIENVASKSSKTSGGYRYTLQQFYA